MNIKCNGCNKTLNPPPILPNPAKFRCPSCGMRYTQTITRTIEQD